MNASTVKELGFLQEWVGCGICRSESSRPEFQENGFWLNRCTSCGHFYVSPRPLNPGTVDEGGEKIPSPEIHKKDEIQRIPFYKNYICWVKRFEPGRRWLDIGCGCGTFMEVLHQAGYKIEGIETDEQRLSHCRSRGLEVHPEPIESNLLSQGSFDVVSMINVFSHIRDPIILFNAIKRVLRPDGIIFLTTSQCGEKAYKGEVSSWYLGDHHHFAGPNTFKNIASKLGKEAITLKRELTQTVVLKEKLLYESERIWVNWVKKAFRIVPILPKIAGAMICLFHGYASPRHEVAILFRKIDS